MLSKRATRLGGLVILCTLSGWWLLAADKAPPASPEQAFHDGNYRDAYDVLHARDLAAATSPAQIALDLPLAVQALRNLGRSNELDAYLDAVLTAHPRDWQVLQAAALVYTSPQVEHYGFLVAGSFQRAHHRGGGRYVGTFERDRTRALQLLEKARTLADNASPQQRATLLLHTADALLQGAGSHDPWRLQYLTDLAKLPDYQEGGWWFGGTSRGAPVDADNQPIYPLLPTTLEKALNDGRRWRWLLTQAAQLDPARQSEIDMRLAVFLHGQFDVQTMAGYGLPPVDSKSKSGPYSVHTLSDGETIARLASGIQRFAVPRELQWIRICKQVAERGTSPASEQACDLLAGIYENRRQLVKAAEAWQRAIRDHGPGPQDFRSKRLEQIIGSWGRFEPGREQAAGKKAILDYRYRNGSKVSFEAYPVDVPRLLADVQNTIRQSGGQVDWNRTSLHDIGYRLVTQNEQQYLGKKTAAWQLDLQPPAGHVDDLVTVHTPLDRPGAYLVRAQMEKGNTSHVLVWLSDTVILKKQLEGKVLYYVADAVSGQPIAAASLDLFGWRQVWNFGAQQPRIEHASHRTTSNEDGQAVLGEKEVPGNMQWLVIARKARQKDERDDRFAYLGFSNVWYGQQHDVDYQATRVFVMTDRPVYRPTQKVQLKAWVRHARYDLPDDHSDFAGQSFTVRIHNPRNEKVLEKSVKADAYGGLSEEMTLPAGALLGVYSIQVDNLGGGSFRVEEYKKPEFEVEVEAPREPARLGEKIRATVKAKYYFGAPVASARVKLKVLRTSHNEAWYPQGAWDWLYGPGYWWFAGNYDWFPGWQRWGCKRPVPPWLHGGHEQPEVVQEQERTLPADGTLAVEIDTRPARELHGDQDHAYTITAEVTDQSRRTIVGTGKVLVSRQPFQVVAWLERGHYQVGDTVRAHFHAHTPDGKPVAGKGELRLYQVRYDEQGEPQEKEVRRWSVDSDSQGEAVQQLKASRAGQYRLSYRLTDSKEHTQEGGYLFVVRGAGFDGQGFRFNDLELVTDRREYAPGERVKLLVNTNRLGSVVLLFVRPSNGVYLAPKVLRLEGKSVQEEVAVVKKDMPNFYVEAVTVSGGQVHTEVREVVVPPEKRVLNVAVEPSQKEYRPGQKGQVKVKVTDFFGKPYVGSVVLSMYDRSVEYISGGSNVPEIRSFFWSWRRHHQPWTETSLVHGVHNLLRQNEVGMNDLGVFGFVTAQQYRLKSKGSGLDGKENAALGHAGGGGGLQYERAMAKDGAALSDGEADAAPGFAKKAEGRSGAFRQMQAQSGKQASIGQPPTEQQQPTVRQNFADTALWRSSLTTDAQGFVEVPLTLPENLTGWKIMVWVLGHGTRVGQADALVTTRKDLLVRLQAPRFFVQNDLVTLSANVHNYLKTAKQATVSLELDGNTLHLLQPASQQVSVPAGGEKRVDWQVRVTSEGQATVRVKALTDEESDAMQMSYPCLVHGMLKTDSFSAVIRPSEEQARFALRVPQQRRPEQTRLEVRYSPTLAGALVDALPYLVDYPYGCSEQTLNRFLPTVLTQRVLQRMNLDLKDIRDKRTNLNAQEIGDARQRARGWQHHDEHRNPVFDEDEVKAMVKAGLERLTAMQCSDGGWGWFSGSGEQSWPHTTAVVVHGLQVARDNDVALTPNLLERGIAWLQSYQADQVQRIKNAPGKVEPYKEHADDLDALIYKILVDDKKPSADMRELLYRDRTHLAVSAKALFGLALHSEKQADKLAMILKNLDQYVVEDDDNQTAYLRLPEGNAWWHWSGSETETQAYYLQLLSRTAPQERRAGRLVKYLLNNRKHAAYWNSTRDTALCIEAMADYLRASGEDRPDLTVEVWLDGKKHKEVAIQGKNLFSFDGTLLLEGAVLTGGKHELEIRKKGTGPLYCNAYLSTFTLEDQIERAGLEVKVNRKYYKLTPVEHTVKVSGSRGQALDQKVEKYERSELESLATLTSGELVEVELEIDSKNDYEYVIFEDPKAAGFEPLLVRSGYNGNELGAYMELRDQQVSFFVRALARGKHSVSYRLRAEIPGQFSALPAKAWAMYAPELRGNSDEIKLKIKD